MKNQAVNCECIFWESLRKVKQLSRQPKIGFPSEINGSQKASSQPKQKRSMKKYKKRNPSNQSQKVLIKEDYYNQNSQEKDYRKYMNDMNKVSISIKINKLKRFNEKIGFNEAADIRQKIDIKSSKIFQKSIKYKIQDFEVKFVNTSDFNKNKSSRFKIYQNQPNTATNTPLKQQKELHQRLNNYSADNSFSISYPTYQFWSIINDRIWEQQVK